MISAGTIKYCVHKVCLVIVLALMLQAFTAMIQELGTSYRYDQYLSKFPTPTPIVHE